jgi:1-acyl-sn-glycerol-3-phosphate acyltransferase
MLLHRFPREDSALKSQTELTNIDDTTYRNGYVAPPSSFFDRIIQVIFFIVFFGWLRALVFVATIAVFMIAIIPLALACEHETWRLIIHPITSWFARWIVLPVVRFCLGVYRVRIHGKRDPTARCLIYNHTSLLDGPIIYIYSRFTIVIMAGIMKIPILGRALKGAEAVFIDRSTNNNNSKVISGAMEDHGIAPLAVAPEGKISNGDYLFRFRTGAFLTAEEIQPITMRYTHFLPFGKTTLNSLPRSDIEWFWLAFCCPAGMCDLTYLEPIRPSSLEGKTPRERADMAELILANALGTLASARSSHEIFAKKAPE